MYTKRTFSLKDAVWWTRRETALFVLLAVIPVVLHQVLDQHWLHLPWLPVALVGTAVAFLISFKNNATYDRLWEARKIWGSISNRSRAWGAMVNDFVNDQFASEPAGEAELQDLRKDVVHRHIAWLTALRHAMRQPRAWEDHDRHKTNREWTEKIGVREHHVGLEEDYATCMPEEDRAYIQSKSNQATHLMSLQSKALRRLRARGLIDDFRHMEMQKMITDFFDLQGRSERIKNFPYPRQYATINVIFLWIFILLIPVGVMFEFDKLSDEMQAVNPSFATWFPWLAVPFSVIVMWVFHTMERIGRVSENPFEGTPNDVPITSMARAIEIELREMLGEDPETIPEPIVPVHGTLT